MVALAIARAAAAARHAVVHDVPAQQRDPLDLRVARQRPAGGHRRGGEPQHGRSRSNSPAPPAPTGNSGSWRTTGSRRRPSRATRRRKPGRTRRSRSRPPASSRSRSTDSGGSRSIPRTPTTTSGRSTSTSVVAGEARPLRIIVDDPNPPAAGSRADSACATPIPRSPRSCLPIPGPADMKLRHSSAQHAARPPDRQLPARGADRDPHLRVRRPRPDRPAREARSA